MWRRSKQRTGLVFCSLEDWGRKNGEIVGDCTARWREFPILFIPGKHAGTFDRFLPYPGAMRAASPDSP